MPRPSAPLFPSIVYRGSSPADRSKTCALTEEDALSEGHRILLLLNALSTSDPNESRRISYKSAAVVVRRALK